ncbi:MAG: hypothetical protein DRP47_00570 [Candidatus Zixiibacteriota bacterium]|nr:MAG: hypothetical protein DRP47_00570 [candidate division Zixibacteria bacterium]
MANDEEKTVVEAGEGDPQAEEGSPGKGGGSKKLILFGGIGLGAVIVGVVLALFVIKPMMSGSGADPEQEQGTEEVAKTDHSEAKKKEEHKKPKKSSHGGGHGESAADEGIMCSIDDIVVNPAGTGGSRYLSVSFSFELESSEAQSTFEGRKPIIRDALITILSSKTVAQLTDPKQKEIVRYQIKKRISKLLKTDELAGVYYTDFVLQ